MVDNIVTKLLALVLIAVAHMVFNVHSQAEVPGILGDNITLSFKFNTTLTKNSHFGVYKIQLDSTKIAEFNNGSRGDVFKVYPRNSSVSWHISNLTLNDNGSYFVSLYSPPRPPKESNRVLLIIREGNKSSTVPTIQSDTSIPEQSGSSSLIVTVFVVSPVVLLVAVLLSFICCLVRAKGKQETPQQNSTPTVQETVEASTNVPGSSVVYSVLDFPKRPSAVLEMNPSDTEYAAVSYLQEKRQG